MVYSRPQPIHGFFFVCNATPNYVENLPILGFFHGRCRKYSKENAAWESQTCLKGQSAGVYKAANREAPIIVPRGDAWFTQQDLKLSGDFQNLRDLTYDDINIIDRTGLVLRRVRQRQQTDFTHKHSNKHGRRRRSNGDSLRTVFIKRKDSRKRCLQSPSDFLVCHGRTFCFLYLVFWSEVFPSHRFLIGYRPHVPMFFWAA